MKKWLRRIISKKQQDLGFFDMIHKLDKNYTSLRARRKHWSKNRYIAYPEGFRESTTSIKIYPEGQQYTPLNNDLLATDWELYKK